MPEFEIPSSQNESATDAGARESSEAHLMTPDASAKAAKAANAPAATAQPTVRPIDATRADPDADGGAPPPEPLDR